MIVEATTRQEREIRDYERKNREEEEIGGEGKEGCLSGIRVRVFLFLFWEENE